MKILSFDTTTRDLVAALYIDGKVTGRVEPDCLKGHSEILLPAIDALLDEAGVSLEDMDYFAACVGPGSFTGIRIGVTTLRTFCQVTGRPAIPVNSLEYRAYTVPSQKTKCVALDAMQNKLYYALYEGDREIKAPDFCEREEFYSRIPEDCWILSDTELDRPWEGFAQLQKRLAEFTAAHLSRAVGYERVQPLYLRRCQAEEDLERRK